VDWAATWAAGSVALTVVIGEVAHPAMDKIMTIIPITARIRCFMVFSSFDKTVTMLYNGMQQT
jgi:hypothetical protein